MKTDILNNLNSEQKQAVLNTDGPMIILAGAGSGKTRVLTHKVLYLITEKNVHPQNILMVTFTNKAASEMRERIEKNISPLTSKRPTIATFHSLCAKILRIDGHHIGLSNRFAIYDSQDQLEAIKEAMQKLSLSVKDYKPQAVLSTISQAKNELIDSTQYRSIARGHFQEVVGRIYAFYHLILKENDAIDFDDLLLKTIELFQNNPDILEKYQEKFHYILVDEYQDTNHAQYQLTKLLAHKYNNICVVGDFSQSIYSWRGADYRNLTRFKETFQNTKTFSLSQNYRSTQKILDAASTIIANNTTHPVLTLWTKNPSGEEITIYEARTEQEEAEFILHQIANYKYYKQYHLSEIAILYRTNAQSRVIEEVLLHNAIPYKLIGGTRFYERKEIKDVLAYLRVLANKKDMVSYKRIEKLGKGRLQKFLDYQSTTDISSLKTIDILDQVLKHINYLSLYDEEDQDDRERLENIKELRSVAIGFPEIVQFLENVALVEQEQMPDQPQNRDRNEAITLMTMHAAKGLEFKVVFIIGMEEGLFPHSRALMDQNELEEERRLCYVGVTRAQEKLFLTYARRRLFFGQRTSNTVSRFIMELPEQVLDANIHTLPNKGENIPDFL